MNRHERRKAFALGQAVGRGETVPEGYVRTCEAMIKALRAYRREFPKEPWPQFRLPHKGIMIAAGIDQAPLLCVDELARRFVRAFSEIAELIDPGSIAPTVLMLDVALSQVGAPVMRVSPGELGFDTAGRTFTPKEKVPPS